MTLDDLTNALDDEFALRRKQLQPLLVTSKLPDFTLAQCIVALSYAHYEGFLHVATRSFLSFVTHQKLPNGSLRSGVIALLGWNTMKARFPATSLPSRDLISKIGDVYDPLFRFDSPDAIDLESNVSSSVLLRLVECLGFPTVGNYEAQKDFVDRLIVDPRNAVAHGSHLEITADVARSRAEDLFKLMRAFKDDLQNVAVTKAYLRPVPKA